MYTVQRAYGREEHGDCGQLLALLRPHAEQNERETGA